MSVPTYNVKSVYIGANNLASYSFTFKITDLSQLRVLVVSTANLTTVFDVRGTDTTNLLSVVFDKDNGGGTVTLPANLATGRTIYLLLQNDAPVQLSRFRNQFDMTMKRVEDAYDYGMSCIQYLTHKMHRSVTISDIDSPTTFNPQLPPGLGTSLAAGRFPVLSDDGTGWAPLASWKKLSDIVSGSGAGSDLGLPTDGVYGDGLLNDSFGNPTGDSVTGVVQGITINDAFDDVVTALGNLLPTAPAKLSATPLAIASSYGPILESGTGLTRSVAIDSTSPVVATTGAFGNGKTGILSATMDAANVGNRTLTSGSDVGTYGQLQITSDVDPYAGVAGSGIYQALRAQINATLLSLGLHTAQLSHTLTGSSTLPFAVDDPGTPVASGGSISAVTPTTGYISGVPSYVSGVLAVAFSVANAVRSHYNATKVGSVVLNASTANIAPPGTAPTSGSALALSANITVPSAYYSNAVPASATGYNSKGGASTPLAITSSIRVDTISNESTRVTSGTGGFPTISAGNAGQTFDSTVSLATTKELQMIGGVIQYPPLVSYTTKLPVGPDYSALTSDTSYNNVRWYTKKLGTAASASNWTFTIGGGINIPAMLAAGFYVFLKVNGATGWLNANAAYNGVSTPSADNDSALDVANSTATVRKVSFGTTVRSGDVYVRIGIPSGSISFTGVS